MQGEGVDLHDISDSGPMRNWSNWPTAACCKLAWWSSPTARNRVCGRLLVWPQHAMSYPQHGVVANLIAETAHRDTAVQWFVPDGSILALLPLPGIAGRPAVSMVWSTDPRRAALLCRNDR